MSDDGDSNEYITDDNNYNVIINGNTVHHTIRQDDIKITVSIETTENQLPKTWRKGKLLGVKGQEVADAEVKEWGLGKATKAKAPVEDKSK